MQAVGIVHFGLGAFARAHLAAYCDAAMQAGERDWMIAGVSLRSADVAQQLNPQDGLFTLCEQGGEGTARRVIGSVREVMVASEQRERIVAAIAAPSCRIVTFTVTEKGYCRVPDGTLDRAAAEASFYPLLAEGLARRKAAGLPGLTLLSCDNLAQNGQQLRSLLDQYLSGDLREWFAAHCTTPCAMVDRIVPATAPAGLDACEAVLGQRDEGAVFAEPFSQWVIEDAFAGPRPRWEKHGVQIVSDVTPYETAKLRMLNGAHSLLAYAGLARGHDFVHQAIADPCLRPLAERLMRDEAAPTVTPARGQRLDDYAEALLQRFGNPATGHRLEQIAMDGSQKVPQRWLPVLAEARAPCPAILTGIAAWMVHVEDAAELHDPLAEPLRAAMRTGRDITSKLDSIFGLGGLVQSDWRPSRLDIAFIEATMAQLRTAASSPERTTASR
ncbi:MAG: mannitol dehydrogenase [Erythrobacter sp.]|nr:mannitol dehydrogenase [Erythrobacter sp.]